MVSDALGGRLQSRRYYQLLLAVGLLSIAAHCGTPSLGRSSRVSFFPPLVETTVRDTIRLFPVAPRGGTDMSELHILKGACIAFSETG